MNLESINQNEIWGWIIVAFILLLATIIIVKGWRAAPVPKEAFSDEKHPMHKRARKIYAVSRDSWGLSHQSDNSWEFDIGIGLILLSWLATGMILVFLKEAPKGTFYDKVHTTALLYVLSYLLIFPGFIYLVIAAGLAKVAVKFSYWLMGNPLPPPPPSIRRHYQPKPAGCRFPGDYQGGEDD